MRYKWYWLYVKCVFKFIYKNLQQVIFIATEICSRKEQIMPVSAQPRLGSSMKVEQVFSVQHLDEIRYFMVL